MTHGAGNGGAPQKYDAGNQSVEEVDITRVDRDRRTARKDLVAREVPLTMHVNGSELVTLLASPTDLRDLCVGFLYSSGLVRTTGEVQSLTVDEERWRVDIRLGKDIPAEDLAAKRMYTSGCGRGVLFYHAIDILHRQKNTSPLSVPARTIYGLMAEFNDLSRRFQLTGGVHSAALASLEKILTVREDIGRHNAVDKVIGAALAQDIDFPHTIVLTSGRISSEIILKIQKTGSPVIVSRSAPTNQGVRLAADLGLTLVGFVRGQRMNIYSGGERIAE